MKLRREIGLSVAAGMAAFGLSGDTLAPPAPANPDCHPLVVDTDTQFYPGETPASHQFRMLGDALIRLMSDRCADDFGGTFKQTETDKIVTFSLSSTGRAMVTRREAVYAQASDSPYRNDTTPTTHRLTVKAPLDEQGRLHTSKVSLIKAEAGEKGPASNGTHFEIAAERLWVTNPEAAAARCNWAISVEQDSTFAVYSGYGNTQSPQISSQAAARLATQVSEIRNAALAPQQPNGTR